LKREAAFFYLPKGEKSVEGAACYFFQRQGKVRDVYSTEDNRFFLIVASDRISGSLANSELIEFATKMRQANIQLTQAYRNECNGKPEYAANSGSHGQHV